MELGLFAAATVACPPSSPRKDADRLNKSLTSLSRCCLLRRASRVLPMASSSGLEPPASATTTTAGRRKPWCVHRSERAAEQNRTELLSLAMLPSHASHLANFFARDGARAGGQAGGQASAYLAGTGLTWPLALTQTTDRSIEQTKESCLL